MDVSVLRKIAPKGKEAILEMVAREDSPSADQPLVTAHYLAQVAHESDGFRTTVEYASGKAYEGRKDLGNTKKGDGVRFKGRGVIQLTGRANYQAFTADMRKAYPDCPDFTKEPEKVAEAPWAARAAIWYWNKRRITAKVKGDDQDIVRVTKAINGGLNGIADRKVYLARALDALEIDQKPEKAADRGMLKEGDTGPAVRALQEDLKALGYYRGNVDDIFGPDTTNAVMYLQRERGLTQDGKVGPQTWESLKEDRTPKPISEQRKNATVETLREKGDGITKLTDNLKTAATVAGLGATGTAGYQASTERSDPTTVSTQLSTAAEKALEQADRARDFTDRAMDTFGWVTGKFGSVIAWFIERPWLLVMVGLAVAMWWYAKRTAEERVEMHRQGRD